MEEPATTNSTLTKSVRASTAEMTAVPLLQTLLYQLRSDLNATRKALDSERAAMRTLQRDRVAEIKAVREEEAQKCRNLLSDLKSRLESDHEDALHRHKDAITKTLNNEMLHDLKAKDAEIRQALKEAQAREQSLKLQLRDAVRTGRDAAGSQQTGADSGAIQKLQQEVTALRSQNKQLEQRLQVVAEADRQKASDLRSQHEEHEKKLVQLKKTSQQEIHKLLTELKSKERTILQLERQTERLQEQREKLLERHDRDCECTEVNYVKARDGSLVRRLGELQTTMKKAVDTHAREKMEMVTDSDLLVPSDEELETQRTVTEDEQRAIDVLQEEMSDKNRKLDQLTNRHRKEDMRKYYKHFMELEPVAELEEDSGAGDDSPTSSGSPSLSPQPYSEDTWAKLPDKRYYDTLYSCLLKEHLELQREYQFLQSRLKRELAEPNRIRLRLEHELAATRTHVRKLKRKLADQEGGSAVLTKRIADLQAEAHDLSEQNELLEFRILELQECHESSPVTIHGPDTRDVWTDMESDVTDWSAPSVSSSDSEDNRMGRELRNLSETAGINDSSKFTSRIIATVLPFIDQSVDADKKSSDGEGDEMKKQLKNAECLQESGIFEETEYNSQGTQTESTDIEHSIMEVKPPFEACVVGDLSAEIQRLNQFRERVEEAGNCCGSKKLLRVGEGRGDEPPLHRKEVEYCRERLQILEDKVRVYESSGEVQMRLLAERLQKEVLLSAKVKDLTARVQHLVTENRHLEEEKCEFEEAENDTRLKCQKLEVKLSALSEKKADIQAQLQQERRTVNRLRSTLFEAERKEYEPSLQTILNKYEQRNYDLEERQVELKHRLEMLEKVMPVLVMWKVWRLMQNTGIYSIKFMEEIPSALVKASIANRYNSSVSSGPNTSLQLSVMRYSAYSEKEQSYGLPDVKQEYEAEKVWRTEEERLRSRLQFLEDQTCLMKAEIQQYKESEDTYKKRISELENETYSLKNGSQLTVNKETAPTPEERALTELSDNQLDELTRVRCENMEYLKRLQELLQSEADMKKRINELEMKERAYMETLQQADELWSGTENWYKKSLSEAEEKEALLREKVRKFEENETKFRQAFQYEEENEGLLERIQNMEKSEKMVMEKIRVLQTEKDQLMDEANQLRDAMQSMQNELERTKKMVAGPLKEELLKERKMCKTLENEITKMERQLQEKSSSEQAQINGLKMQLSRTSRELVDLECTNGELKEEVETLEANILELKTVIEKQEQAKEKLVITMSQTIQQREQELEEARREMRFAQTPSAQKELSEADKSLLHYIGEKTSRPEGMSSEQERAKEIRTQPSEGPFTKPDWSRSSRWSERPPPVSTMKKKPVLRRWVLSQPLQLNESSNWREC